MKKILIAVLMLVAFPTFAQTPANAKSKLGWEQEAGSLQEIATYTYKYYLDGSSMGIVLRNVTCTGTVSPYQCEAPFPVVTKRVHNLVLTASNSEGVSPKSTPPLSFLYGDVPPPVVPPTPAGVPKAPIHLDIRTPDLRRT